MKKKQKNNWKRCVLIAAPTVLIIGLILLDASNLPSGIGIKYIRFDWIEILLTLGVGLMTLRLTVTVAKQQEKIEGDKIASEKFFRIEFIERYQRIITKNKSPVLKLKIKELDNDALKSLEVVDDVTITPIEGDAPDDAESFSVNIRKDDRYEFEHTDDGMDKDWPKNPNKVAFCLVNVYLGDIDISKFEEGKRYKFDMSIVATDVFNVEVKCRLHTWLKVEEKQAKRVNFSVVHNYGYYDSVKYSGPTIHDSTTGQYKKSQIIKE